MVNGGERERERETAVMSRSYISWVLVNDVSDWEVNEVGEAPAYLFVEAFGLKFCPTFLLRCYTFVASDKTIKSCTIRF